MTNGDTKTLELIGSITSSIIVGSFCVLMILVAMTDAAFSGIPSMIVVLYSFVVSLAIIQVVGIDVLKAYSSMKNDQSSE